MAPPMKKVASSSVLFAVFGVAAWACAPKQPLANTAQDEKPKALPCQSAGASKPLVIDWPAAEQAALQAGTSGGLMVLAHDGCHVQLLRECKAKGSYNMIPTSGHRSFESIKNEVDLSAKLPLWFASLSAELKTRQELTIDMFLSGEMRADRVALSRADLEGICEKATHTIVAMQVGAYSLYTGSSRQAGVEANLPMAGVGTKLANEHVVLQHGCEEPDPTRCHVPLRVELLPISENSTVQCPADKQWDGQACVIPIDKRTFKLTIESLSGPACRSVAAMGCDYRLELLKVGSKEVIDKRDGASGQNISFQWVVKDRFSAADLSRGLEVKILDRGTITNKDLGTCGITHSMIDLTRMAKLGEVASIPLSCADGRTLTYRLEAE